MKKLLIILVSIFAFAGYSFAQADENPSCPKLEITGPTGLMTPGDTADYSVKVETGGTDLKLEYIWSVSTGEIISGQNTPSITVRFGNQGVTTTAEIKGLPEGCPNTASESGGCGLVYLAERLERFKGPITLADKPRFEKILEALRNDPSARVSVFIGYRTARELKEKKRIVVKYLGRFVPAAVTWVNVPAEVDLTEVWLVPLGARDPRVEEGIVVQ
jgi:hypothetical protein